MNLDSLSQSPRSYLYTDHLLVPVTCTRLISPTSPGPTKAVLPPPCDQPWPTLHPSGRGTPRSWGHKTTHTQKGLLLTLGHRPMPKELLSAIWCRYRSVLKTEGTRSKGGRAHTGSLGEQVVTMVWGSTQCPRWPQSWPRALAPLPKYSSLAALTGPFLRKGLPEASLLRSYPALRTESFLSHLSGGYKCPSGLIRRLRTGGASPSNRGGRQETNSGGHRGEPCLG